ncbi:transposase [Candidatus Kaiserbacteria bacterium]|nr:transposase [Candidatus Kaiserbacteria bacterium]
MRVEPYSIDSIVHVVKRGARGLPITRDDADRRRFTRLLYYLNDEHQSEFWELDVKNVKNLEWPKQWPRRRPLVSILAWTLMPNHFHLILKEIQAGGISRFMQRICGSMSRHFNEKYDEKGSIFQGAYRSRTIDTDRYLRWAIAYVLVKNVFEMYPRGYARAAGEFEKAWKWGTNSYRFSSLSDYVSGQPSPIIERELLKDFFISPADFKACARDMVTSRLEKLAGTNEGVVFE